MKQNYKSLRKIPYLVLNSECVGRIWGLQLSFEIPGALWYSENLLPPSTPISQELWLGALGERVAEFLGVMDTMEIGAKPQPRLCRSSL